MLPQEMAELNFEAVVYYHSEVTENIPLTSTWSIGRMLSPNCEPLFVD